MSSKQVNEFNISGKVIWVGMPISFGAGNSELIKRVLVLEVWADNKYRQEVPFDYVNQNTSLLNNIRENDWVNVDFILRGRKNVQSDGKARWYSNLEGISCTKEE